MNPYMNKNEILLVGNLLTRERLNRLLRNEENVGKLGENRKRFFHVVSG